jgi:hypothetical protein
MKIKLDENLPHGLAGALHSLSHDFVVATEHKLRVLRPA